MAIKMRNLFNVFDVIRGILGEYANEYDIEGIASEAAIWVEDGFELIDDDATFWRIVEENERHHHVEGDGYEVTVYADDNAWQIIGRVGDADIDTKWTDRPCESFMEADGLVHELFVHEFRKPVTNQRPRMVELRVDGYTRLTLECDGEVGVAYVPATNPLGMSMAIEYDSPDELFWGLLNLCKLWGFERFKDSAYLMFTTGMRWWHGYDKPYGNTWQIREIHHEW